MNPTDPTTGSAPGSAPATNRPDAREIHRPTVRVNEFGVYAFPPDLATAISGHTVTVHDWYGANTLTVTGVEIGRNGYPSALTFTRADGREGAFSLHTTREIEMLA